MNKIEAVIFDMDGVIFDTEKAYLDNWIKVFEKYGYKMAKEVYISVMGRGRRNVIKTFQQVYGDDLPITRMYKEKDKMFMQEIEEGKVLMKPGVNEILSFLKENRFKIALATSAKRERTMLQLEIAGIGSKFDVVVCGNEIANSKPDPEIFLKAAQKLSVAPSNCVVIEDSPAGIKAAFNAKMVGIHIEDLKKADEEILKYCHKSFKNLFEIRKHFRESMNEMLYE